MVADVNVENHGSVCLVRPNTTTAEEWIAENVETEPWQWQGGAMAVEPRYLDNLVEGMRDYGLTVEVH